MSIEFKNPPGGGSGTNKWQPVREELMARPGEWALIATLTGPSAYSLASMVRKGTGAWGRGRFEATVRKGDVYARYIGPREH